MGCALRRAALAPRLCASASAGEAAEKPAYSLALKRGDLRRVLKSVSAGTHPAGYVHPLALQALAEIGIAHTGRSKSADEFRNRPFDLVVTVCDDAAENCPVWLGRGQKAHLGFPDPAKATGTDEEILAAFRAVRDDIARKVPALLLASVLA